jgi:hypothetical protein
VCKMMCCEAYVHVKCLYMCVRARARDTLYNAYSYTCVHVCKHARVIYFNFARARALSLSLCRETYANTRTLPPSLSLSVSPSLPLCIQGVLGVLFTTVFTYSLLLSLLTLYYCLYLLFTTVFTYSTGSTGGIASRTC